MDRLITGTHIVDHGVLRGAVKLALCLVFGLLLLSVFWWVGFLATSFWVLQKITGFTGLDVSAGRFLAFLILGAGLVLPLWALVIPWRYRGRIVVLVTLTTIFALSMDYGIPPGRYFVRHTGGYLFSDTPGVDQDLGVRYKPVTLGAAMAYLHWKVHPRASQVRHSPCPVIVDPSTGEISCWWNPQRNGLWDFSALPGRDSADGSKMAPVTPEVLADYGSWRSHEQETVRQHKEARERKEQADHEWERKRNTVESGDAFKALTVTFQSVDTCVAPTESFQLASNRPIFVPRLEQCTSVPAELLPIPAINPERQFQLEHDFDQLAYRVWKTAAVYPGEKLRLLVRDSATAHGVVVLPAGSIIQAVVTAHADGQVIRVGMESIIIRLPRGRNRPFRAHVLADGTLWRSGIILTLALDENFPN